MEEKLVFYYMLIFFICEGKGYILIKYLECDDCYGIVFCYEEIDILFVILMKIYYGVMFMIEIIGFVDDCDVCIGIVYICDGDNLYGFYIIVIVIIILFGVDEDGLRIIFLFSVFGGFLIVIIGIFGFEDNFFIVLLFNVGFGFFINIVFFMDVNGNFFLIGIFIVVVGDFIEVVVWVNGFFIVINGDGEGL